MFLTGLFRALKRSNSKSTFFWTFFQRTKRLDCNAAARNKSSRLFIGRPFLHHLPCLVLNHLEVCKKVPQKQLEEKDTFILLMTYAPPSCNLIIMYVNTASNRNTTLFSYSKRMQLLSFIYPRVKSLNERDRCGHEHLHDPWLFLREGGDLSGEQNQVIDWESFIFEHSIVGLGTYSMYYVCYLVSWLLGKLKNIFPVPIFIEPNACVKYSNISNTFH